MPVLVNILVCISTLKIVFDFTVSDRYAPYSVVIESLQFAVLMAIIINIVIKKERAQREKLLQEVESLKQQQPSAAGAGTNGKRNKWLTPLNWIILGAVLVLVLFSVRKFEYSIYRQNEARAMHELKRIHKMEQAFYTKHNRYGLLAEIRFNTKYGYSGIQYSLDVSPSGFLATAMESPGYDAFGDNRPGNQYRSITQTGSVFEGAMGLW